MCFLCVLSLGYVFLMMRYVAGWCSLKEFKRNPLFVPKAKITVLIPARNEEESIGRLLECYNNQSYPKELLEVIVINDNSTDDTEKIVNEWLQKAGFTLKLIQLDKNVPFGSFKKAGLTKGVELAVGEIIVTNDADCFMGEHYLKRMVEQFVKSDSKMLLGPVAFTGLNNFISKFQAIDFFSMIGIAGASANNNFPQVCNGANLMYSKEAFFEVNGFKDVDEVPSGDDMFLMQKIDCKWKGSVNFIKSLEACVYTYPMPTVKDFFNQRIRWASKSSKLIDKRVIAILAWMLLFNLMLVANLLIGLITAKPMSIVLFVLWVKILFDFTFLYLVAKFFKQRKLLSLFIPSQITHLVYIIVVGVLSNFIGFNWKGRVIK